VAADIDFDELDRAVSSLIGKVPSDIKPDTKVDDASPVSTEASAPSSLSSTAPTPAADAGEKIAVSISKPASAPAAEVTPTAVTPATPAARRVPNGRFMDMMHPSADMRPNAGEERPSLVPPKAPTPAAAPVPVTPAVSTASVAPTPENPLNSQAATVDDEAAKLDSLLTKGLSLDEPPQSSPFLPNPKVEKRPLGAFSPDAAAPATPGATQIVDTPETSNDPVPPVAELTATAFALQPSEDLVKAVENEQAQAASKAAEKAAEDETKAKEEEKKADLAKLDAEAQVNLTSDMNMPLPEELQSDVLAIESAAPAAEPTIPATAPTGPTSIVPQYKEKASSAKPSGAIYDTEAYHKPLQHPVQKKSGLLLVLVIVGIIIVGGGVGAAVYFIGLPLLQK